MPRWAEAWGMMDEISVSLLPSFCPFLFPCSMPTPCCSTEAVNQISIYLLYFIIYWQLYTVYSALIYCTPIAARLNQAETFWLAGLPWPSVHTPAFAGYQRPLGTRRPHFRMSGHSHQIQFYSGYASKKKQTKKKNTCIPHLSFQAIFPLY